MPTFQAIAAMSENRVIGDHGKIPWHFPEDFRWFKHKTMGGTLIMGRKTFASIGKPLPGRKTIVLSRGEQFSGIETCADLAALDAALANSPAPYWVCGGAEIYALMLKLCTSLYLTRVRRFVEGDVFFPPFEDTFAEVQIIHENKEFCVELWRSKIVPTLDPTATESWPIKT